jgi:F420-non-reducing hydrogenase iron-sulfur subunit
MNNNHQIGRIVAFCCNYTASVATDTLREAGLIPESLDVKKLPCTGRVEVPALLAAFEQGADAVLISPAASRQPNGSDRPERF